MADDRTTITELATALGFTGHTTLEEAVEACPDILKIESDEWERLRSVHRSGEWASIAETAFQNGRSFSTHADGLSGRIPQRIDWSGGRRIVVAAQRGQPRVDWTAEYRDLAWGQRRRVRGHVEIRWSHRPFCGPPEAKVYLDTSHEAVPGYVDLDGWPDTPVYEQQRLIDDRS